MERLRFLTWILEHKSYVGGGKGEEDYNGIFSYEQAGMDLLPGVGA